MLHELAAKLWNLVRQEPLASTIGTSYTLIKAYHYFADRLQKERARKEALMAKAATEQMKLARKQWCEERRESLELLGREIGQRVPSDKDEWAKWGVAEGYFDFYGDKRPGRIRIKKR